MSTSQKARYRDKQTGRIITVEGGEPSDEELDAMFADGGEMFRMRASAPERSSTVRPIPPAVEPSRGPLGGAEAKLSPGEPESALSRGYGAVKEAIFGGPDRAEAREAGIGLQPTPAEMVGTAVGLGATGLAGGGLVRGAAMLPGAMGRAAGPVARVVTSPGGAGALAGAGTLASGGSMSDAIGNAAMTAVGAKSIPAGARAARALAQRAGGAKAVAPKATAPRTRPRSVEAKETPVTPPTAPVTTSRGAEVAARHNALMQFGKKVAAEDPKVGEKIWILLDDAGKPLRRLTPDEAGAAARKGLPTTWIRNLWERSATPARTR